jgi:outer membrane protein TolC
VLFLAAIAAPCALADEVAAPVDQETAPVEQSPAPPAAAATAATPAPEATVTPGTPDTLAALLNKVWRENPTVLKAESEVRATGFDITAARTGYFPYAQVSSALGQSSDESISTLRVVQPLWGGGKTWAQVDTAKAKSRAAIAELARARLQLGQQTAEAFLNIAMGQEQAAQWKRYIDALQRLVSVIKRRSEVGAAPSADVQAALSRWQQALAGQAASRAQLETNRAQLAALIDALPPPVQWPTEEYMVSDQEVADATKRAELHPDRLLAQAQVEIQEGTARNAKANLWPDFSVQYRQQLQGSRFDPSSNATLLVAEYSSTSGLAGYFGYRAQSQRVDETHRQLDATKRQVEATLASDKAQLAAVSSQLAAQLAASDAASTLVDSFLRQFEAGRKSWLDVLNAQREASDNQVQAITVKRTYWLANVKLALDAMYWHRLGAVVAIDQGTMK